MSEDTSLVTVNAFRMKAAREAAGLSVFQMDRRFRIDVRPGEYVGWMPVDDLALVYDLYQVRAGWLQEEGPIASGVALLCDIVGAIDVRVCGGADA